MANHDIFRSAILNKDYGSERPAVKQLLPTKTQPTDLNSH